MSHSSLSDKHVSVLCEYIVSRAVNYCLNTFVYRDLTYQINNLSLTLMCCLCFKVLSNETLVCITVSWGKNSLRFYRNNLALSEEILIVMSCFVNYIGPRWVIVITNLLSWVILLIKVYLGFQPDQKVILNHHMTMRG